MLRRTWTLRSLNAKGTPHWTTFSHRCLSSLAKTHDDEDHREARTWLARFNANTIPNNICEVTFSRSSGPGGQNVNKVNSKATLRIHTKDFMHLVPKILHPDIEASRYYAENSKSLVIQGDGSRDRTDNVQECYKNLRALIIAAGRSSVRGETSPAQVKKVRNLQRKENDMRLLSKKTHGNKKAARKGFSKKSDY